MTELTISGVTIGELGPQYDWGARVRGVTRDNLADESLRERLRALFVARGFIVFEDVEPSPQVQVELSKVFGPLKDHPTRNVPRADPDLAEGVIDMQHHPRDMQGHLHGIVEVDGKRVISFLPWHFDHSYNDELNYAGVLRAVASAPEGGRTGFADGIAIYNRLPADLRARIEDRSVLYTLDVRLTQMRFGRYFRTFGDTESERANTEEARRFPRAIHPMVWTRPTGEKVAHYCGFSAVGMAGHEDPEGDALLEEALQAMYAAIEPYWHDWKPTDMVIWDNLRVLHAVEGCDPRHYRRMQRTTIRGDYGLGRFEGGKKIGEVDREIAPLALPA
ncbi:MAG: TauD/TfdA family dioxygenase [Sphingomonadales bacterium]|nr:TauD/TfdA family dioxygenase [Sphingomonadales bacterium]